MSEILNTRLLNILKDKSKAIGPVQNPPFTAERFVVALINEIMQDVKPEDFDKGMLDELAGAEAVLRASVGDLKETAEKLMEYILNNTNSTFLDDLYMRNTYRRASAASVNKADGVDSATLLTCIVNDPSTAIKSVLTITPPPTEVSDSQPEEDSSERDIDFSENTASAQPEPAAQPADKPTRDDSKQSRSAKTGNMTDLVSDVKRIREKLKATVYGQDNAIDVFLAGYFQSVMLSMIDKNRKRPCATFLFAGPPGVGKTFLAETAAEALGLPFARYDMSEYCEHEAAIEFCGSDGVYKNSKQGNFTAYVSKNPNSVILLDEIEKAHISIIHLFLQVLDAGRLRDSYTDKEVSFKNTILIFTTNAGKQLYENTEDNDLSILSRKVVIDALAEDKNPLTGVPYFPAAICSRFASGNVVMFNHIGAHDLRQVAKKEIEKHTANLKNEMGIDMTLDENVYTALLFSEGVSADARTTKSRAEAFFNDELYELFRLIASEKVKTSVEDIQRIKVEVDLKNAPAEITEMFTLSGDSNVVVLSDEDTVALCRSKKPNCSIISAQSCESALAAIKSNDVSMLILDVMHGLDRQDARLNIEDAETPARQLLKLLRAQKSSIPVYLIEREKNTLDDEERISYYRQGIRGFLKISPAQKNDFASRLNEILSVLHQQAGMLKLAKESKLITFDSAQTVSKNGKTATIQLFDFKASVAIDSKDSKTVVSPAHIPDVHFDDVIGAREAKTELAYFVEYLKNPKKYIGTGVKAPKGVILYGPPGTGKTMLAKAMACEAGVSFIAAEGNQFLKKYVGEGSETVHKLFQTARKYAPSVLFIDEIDAIAKERRGGEFATGSEATLTALLAEMDGFVNDPSKPVFVLAATNFDVEPGGNKSLDPALMRRFDRRVYMELPNKEDRIKFLQMKVDKNPALDVSAVQIENIAVRSTGMSLAELDSVVELALRSAIREGSTRVTDAIFEESFETFNSGEVKKWDAAQLERVARHEAGHALLCWLSGETPSYLTIVARGKHGGYMQHAEQEGKEIYTKDELLAHVRTALGGRAAEIVYYGKRDGVSTGASGDLASATRIARQIVCTYGMDDDFGLSVADAYSGLDDAAGAQARTSVNRILKEQMDEAVRLINDNKDKIDTLVDLLMTQNHLNGTEIDKAMSGVVS